MNIDLSEVVLVAGVILLIVLCIGKPDLLDALIYALTAGVMGGPAK